MNTVIAKMYEHHIREAWYFRKCQHAAGYNAQARAQFEKRANAHAKCATRISQQSKRKPGTVG